MSALAVLTILRNGETLKTQPIEDEAVLGRGEGCVIRLEDRAVSRQHAVFRKTSGGIQVEKKSEFAPLVVNGSECTQALLKDGDVISIGPYLMRLKYDSQTAAQPVETAPLAPQETAILSPVELQEAVPSESAADAAVTSDASVTVPQTDAQIPGMGLSLSEQPALDQNLVGMDSLSVESAATVDDGARTKLTPTETLAVKLVFSPGTANVTEYLFEKDEVSIGRGKNCDIVLNDKKSSRKHAIIRRAGLSFVIKDLGSANGTLVNGVRIREQELSGEDVIRIGEVDFQFKAVSAEYVAQEQNFLSVPAVEASASAEVPAAVPASDVAAPLAGMTPDLNAQPDVAADLSGISGITGVPGLETKKKQSLYEKYIRNFKSLPPKQKAIVAFVVLGLAYFIIFDQEGFQKTKKPVAKKPAAVATSAIKGARVFEALSPENKRFVEAQHTLAFDHYRSKDYDKALYEIEKVFLHVDDYKDSQEIKRYALEGKRKIEALEEERKKKEEEAALKVRISGLVEETKERMSKQQYEQAKELFNEIMAIDPDNAMVSGWKKEIEDFEEQKRLEAQQKQVQEEINKRAWEMLEEGHALRKQGRFHSAIEIFRKIPDIGASDQKVSVKAVAAVKICQKAIKDRRDPVLAEAKQLEDAQDFAKAFQAYKKATVIDPPHPAGYAGMGRIRSILHDKAKGYYTEAVLAESYSDFSLAKRKFKECLEVAPEDDIYYQRAKRKLSHYFRKDEPQP